jgi:radical SAM protein with 4Fe4S-binding SPASM domain
MIGTVEEKPCGAARSGFAIDQKGDIFPCIFGIQNKEQCSGSILSEDINTVWFNSPVFNNFRENNNFPCNSCEVL